MLTCAQDCFVSISVLPLHCAALTIPSGSNSVEFNYISKATLSLRMTIIGSFQKHILHTMSQGRSINSLQVRLALVARTVMEEL